MKIIYILLLLVLSSTSCSISTYHYGRKIGYLDAASDIRAIVNIDSIEADLDRTSLTDTVHLAYLAGEIHILKVISDSSSVLCNKYK